MGKFIQQTEFKNNKSMPNQAEAVVNYGCNLLGHYFMAMHVLEAIQGDEKPTCAERYLMHNDFYNFDMQISTILSDVRELIKAGFITGNLYINSSYDVIKWIILNHLKSGAWLRNNFNVEVISTVKEIPEINTIYFNRTTHIVPASFTGSNVDTLHFTFENFNAAYDDDERRYDSYEQLTNNPKVVKSNASRIYKVTF
jgi:hypothetical protein